MRLAGPQRLVVDPNVIIAALVRDSTVRRIISWSELDLFVPEFYRQELAKHLPLLGKRTGLKERGVRNLVEILEKYLTVIPKEALSQARPRAAAVMGPIDPKDTEYLAAVWVAECDGIWSDDPHFKRQQVVPCWTTKDLVAELRERGLAL